jgi:PTS system, glucose-like IIB component
MEENLRMKDRVVEATQKFARAIIQPVMFLAIIGSVIALSVVLKLEVMPDAVKAVGKFLYTIANDACLSQLSVIFCVGLTTALAKKKKADAAVCGITCYLIYLYANNAILTLTGRLAKPGALGLAGTGQASVFGIQVVDMGVFLGIILGCVIPYVFNRFCDVKFPDAVSIYGGSRAAFFLAMVVTAVLAILFSYIWPAINAVITLITGFISGTGALGVFIYGFLNRILIPTGMHHLVYMPFLFTPVGGVATIAGKQVTGALQIWNAQLGSLSSITSLDASSRFLDFGFSKLFGCIGICLAFIKTAKPEKKAATKGMLLPALFVAVIAGITEPFEFAFLFISPLLWLIHSVLDGLFQMLVNIVGCHVSQYAGIIDFITSNIFIPQGLSKMWLYAIIGLVGTAIWYFLFVFLITKFDIKTPGREDDDEIHFGKGKEAAKLDAENAKKEKIGSAAADSKETAGDVKYLIEGLGGAENILQVNNCFTRLRVEVKDINKLDESIIDKFPNKGIVKKKSNVQIIIGMKVQDVREEIAGKLGME